MATGTGESRRELTGWFSPPQLSSDNGTEGLKTRRTVNASSQYRRQDKHSTRFVPAPSSSTPKEAGAPRITAQKWRKARLDYSRGPAIPLEDVWDQCSWLHGEEREGEEGSGRGRNKPAAMNTAAGSQESGYLSRTPSSPQYTSDSSADPFLQARENHAYTRTTDRTTSPHRITSPLSSEIGANAFGTFLPLPKVDDTVLQSDKESTPRYLGLSSSTSWAVLDAASPFFYATIPQSATSASDRQQDSNCRFGVPLEVESTHSYSPSREPPVGCDSSLASPNRKSSHSILQDDALSQTSTLKLSPSPSPRRRIIARRSPPLKDYKTKVADQEGLSYTVDSVSSDSPTTTSSSHLSATQHHVHHTSAHPLEGLIEAKEKIIIQKDRIIERQKLTVSRLQQECRESEARLRQYLHRQAAGDDPTGIGRRLQELELENASLANQLREMRTAREAEGNRLTKKLGAAEYELQKLTSHSADCLEEKESEIGTLKAQVEERSTRILALTSELSEALNEQHRLKTHVMELEKYVGNMPSVNEFKAMTAELSSLRELKASSSTQLEDQEHLVRGLEAKVAERDERIGEIQAQAHSFSREVDNLRLELADQSKLTQQLSAECAELNKQKQSLEKSIVDVEAHYRLELGAMRKRHHKKFTEATENIRTQHKDLAKRYVAVEKQLQKSSDCIDALHGELQSNQATITELQKSLSSTIAENQALLESNVCLQEDQLGGGAVAQRCVSESPSGERTSLEEWNKELTCAVLEMESLLNVCASLLENQTPDTSQLLGIRESRESSVGLDSHEDRLAEVEKLRKKIDEMRTKVADQFAAEVAKSCNVQ